MKILLIALALITIAGVAFASQKVYTLCYQGAGTCTIVSIANPLPVVAE